MSLDMLAFYISSAELPKHALYKLELTFSKLPDFHLVLSNLETLTWLHPRVFLAIHSCLASNMSFFNITDKSFKDSLSEK